MFIKKNKQVQIDNMTPVKKPKKKRFWRYFFVIAALFLIVFISYIAYIVASGGKIFGNASLSASPFFKKLSGENYTLRGEGDGRINILLLGMGGSGHPGGTLTDSIMVASIDPDNKTLAMLSIPRDLAVTVPNTERTVKINQIYYEGENIQKGSGLNLVKTTISDVLDLPIHYYINIDFYGFKQLIDGLGGLDIMVDKTLYDPYFPDETMNGYEPFYIKAGLQHMDGSVALKYARSRETTSDFDRAARQQKVISAVKEKVLSIGYLANPKKILDLVNIVGTHVKTDFTADEIYALSKIATNLDNSKTVSKVLTSGSTGQLISDSSSGTFYLFPKSGNFEEIQKIAHEIFTDPDLAREDATIELQNGTKTTGLASKLASTLQSYNYNIEKITNAKIKYLKTIIYDNTGGQKPITVEFLKKRLNAAVIIPKDTSLSTTDLTVIIGENYQGFQN